jgi:serine/threonine protein phosphatase PrpC
MVSADAGASGPEGQGVRRVTSGGYSDVGPVRAANEDHLLLDTDLGLFVVADGMGGHQAGEIASQLAVATVAEELRAARAPASAGPDAHGPSAGLPATRLSGALQHANARVYATGAADPALTGMGTTITALLMGASDAVIGSVGDSRAYLVRSGTTVQLTHDDTWLVSALGLDGAREAAARSHPMRHVLTSIIGSRDGHEPEVVSVPVQAGDVFVLTTDGLHNVVDDATIGRLAASAPPEEAAQRLVREALARRTTDNVTVVVVRAE